MRILFRLTLFVFFLQALPLRSQQLVPFRKADQWFLYDKVTHTIFTDTFQAIVPSGCGLLFVQQNGKWGAFNANKKTVLPFQFAEISQLNSQVLFARDNKGIHLFDTLGQPITKMNFTEAKVYRDDGTLIVVCSPKKKYGIIDSKGKTILPLRYDFAPEHIGHGYITVGKKGKLGDKQVGLFDSLFHQVFPIRYREISLLDNSCFVCNEPGNSFVLFDMYGNKLYSGEGKPVRMYTNFILIRKDYDIGVYARKADKSFLLKGGFYYHIWDEHELAAFDDYDANVAYFITADGEMTKVSGYHVMMEEQYTKYFPVWNGDRNKRNNFGMIDQSGKSVLTISNGEIVSWNSSYCAVQTKATNANGKYSSLYSLVDIVSGKEKLPALYDDIVLFPLGGIALKQNGYYRLYNENLIAVDSVHYDEIRKNDRGARLFRDDPDRVLYQVKVNAAPRRPCMGYIDGACHVVIPAIYRDVKLINDNYNNPTSFCRLSASVFDTVFPFQTYGRGMLLDGNGKRLDHNTDSIRMVGYYAVNNFMPIYTDVHYEDEVRTLVGLMDTMGNIIVHPYYDKIESDRNSNGLLFYRNGRVTYAMPNGKPLFPPQYRYVYLLGKTLACVASGSDSVRVLRDNFFVATKDFRKGILDGTGKQITRFDYDEISGGPLLNGTLFKVTRDRKDFYVGIDGTEYYSP